MTAAKTKKKSSTARAKPPPKNKAARARPRRPALDLPPLGAHMSIAGGVDKAVDRARSAGCTALQIFLKNNNQWTGKPLDEEVAERYRTEVAKGDLGRPVAHSSYLVNLAGIKPELVKRSMANLLDDVERAGRLGVPGIVLHPGAHMGEGEAKGIRLIAKRLNELFDRSAGNPTAIYLEATAGQGSAIGYRFEHLRDIIALVEDRSRIAVCLDTCHIFAAGYDIRTRAGVASMLDEFDRVVGLEQLEVFHFNDSKRELGSRVDRHEHIGKGKIGREGFAALMQDRRIKSVPRILETPKGEDLAEDRVNLRTLRRLARA